MDDNAGEKGVAHYWNLLAKIFNDHSYEPASCCVRFADYIDTLEGGFVYDITLLPEYRSPDYLGINGAS